MSIKRYLFLLIGGILVTVAAAQLFIVMLFKDRLNIEVLTKSQQLSHQVLQEVINNVELHELVIKPTDEAQDEAQDQTNISLVKIHASPPDHDIKAIHQIKLLGPITPEQQQRLTKQQAQWKQQLLTMVDQQHQAQTVVRQLTFVKSQSSDDQSPSNLHFELTTDDQSTALNTLIESIIYLIIGSTLVALLLAFWLSNHFTGPLQKLTQGFAALEQGQLGIQVDTTGIAEYQKALSSFNQMSDRLVQLAVAEKTLQQQSHLAELGEVSRGLAHALRNPMHTIGLSVEQLNDINLPQPQRHKLQCKIQAKIKHIDKTIKALLTLTAGQIQRQDKVPLRSVIQDVILELSAFTTDNDSQVKLRLQGEKINPTIIGAESEIRAIVHTLLVNAVEATASATASHPASQSTEVIIEISATASEITMTVTDQGSGLAPQIKAHLFQPHISSKAEGAGMGLYICKRLTELYYHGQISLTDRPAPNHGCIAKVRFSVTEHNQRTRHD